MIHLNNKTDPKAITYSLKSFFSDLNIFLFLNGVTVIVFTMSYCFCSIYRSSNTQIDNTTAIGKQWKHKNPTMNHINRTI